VKTLRIACLLLALATAGCISNKRSTATVYHPLDGLRTDLITDNQLDSGPNPRELVWLNASRVFRTQSYYEYYLEATYAARVESGYLDIGPGPNLVIVADGKEITFTTLGSMNSRKSRGGLVNETALFQAEPAQIQAFANAQKVTVKLIGRNGTVVREFNQANCERFRQFAQKFIPK
jgi:hypothetical protein